MREQLPWPSGSLWPFGQFMNFHRKSEICIFMKSTSFLHVFNQVNKIKSLRGSRHKCAICGAPACDFTVASVVTEGQVAEGGQGC